MRNLTAVGYVLAYVTGLVALMALSPDSIQESGALPAIAAVWSFAFGLMTRRFEALAVPTGFVVVSMTGLVVLLASDGSLIGSDTGHSMLPMYPMIAGFGLLVTTVPMGVGLIVRRALSYPALGLRGGETD
ncbi:MAG TPA: hypothetical protein VEX36_06785 [Thermoleophilaceae bacterium]|nr:hypothetical protein [Thermoleophilaceae bacterium]